MADRWVVDEDYPEGHLVPMTPEENAQLERDRVVAVAAVAAQAKIDESHEAVMSSLRKARTDLATGRIFGSLSAAEKNALGALLKLACP